MLVISVIMAAFSVFGAIDLMIGNRIGIGKEFERGMKMFGELALSMIGMIVLAPLIAHLLNPALKAVSSVIPLDPSIVFSTVFANDMGGAKLALETAADPSLAYYNGLVVASMMGATVSFTLPFALSAVQKEQHKGLLLGLMCGICTIPVGCFVSGLIAGVRFLTLVVDLVPLLFFSALLSFGLLKFPNASVKVFHVFGVFIKILVTVGLAIGIFEALTGWDIVPYTAPIWEGAQIVFNVAVVETGAFPLVFLISKVLKKPLKKLGDKTGINETSAVGFLSTLATSVTTFGMMKDMDDKGVVLNSAFAVSAAFTFADHLAFTMSFNNAYVLPMIVGKVLSGVAALLLAILMYKRMIKKKTNLPLEQPKTDEPQAEIV